jgi:hypothetical protein
MSLVSRFCCRLAFALAVAASAILVTPSNASAQVGLSLRGWVRGLPQSGITLPRTTAVGAIVDVAVERGTSVLSVPIVFPPNSFNLRTADVSAESFQTRIFNGQLLELLVIEENGRLVVRVIRDVPSLRVTGVVTAAFDASGSPVAGLSNPFSDCGDPRECITGGIPGRFTLDLGAASSHAAVTLDMGLGTLFSTIVVGCQYSVEAVVTGGRLFAGRVEIVGPRSGDFCRLTEPTGAHGLTLRGWIAGLPGGAAPLPPSTPVDGYSIVASDRGTAFTPVPVRFPAELDNVRTADAQLVDDEFVAQIRNGIALDLHLIPDGGATSAWVVRDVATLRLKGRVTDVRNPANDPVPFLSGFGNACEDPHLSACVPVAFPGHFTLDIGILASQLATIDVGRTSLVFNAICPNANVAVEAVVTGGRLFAVRVEGDFCVGP